MLIEEQLNYILVKETESRILQFAREKKSIKGECKGVQFRSYLSIVIVA